MSPWYNGYMETKKDTQYSHIENPTLRIMLNEREKWERWVNGDRCKPKDLALPPWRCDEMIVGHVPSDRFEVMASPAGYSPAHVGCHDKLFDRYVVVRTVSLTRWSSNQIISEIEYQKNKSIMWDRYRSLNRRWRQDTRPIEKYKVTVGEGEQLGLVLKHVGDTGEDEVAVGDLVIIDHTVNDGGTIWRVVGRPVGNDSLKVESYFSTVESMNEPRFVTTKSCERLRLLTAAACTTWIMALRTIMREVGNKGR